MLQLIYTSAPRLLETGKSGFGTIARSNNLPLPLIKHLERISIFDRSNGLHQILTYHCYGLFGENYHIFTRIKDSGADYTGRTNHIAHHLIVQEASQEYVELKKTTPAYVLLNFAKTDGLWRDNYIDEPKILDDITFSPDLKIDAFHEWNRLCGNDRCSEWLSLPPYKDGVIISLDEQWDTEEFFKLVHDSFIQADNCGWQIGVCSCLSPSLSSDTYPIAFHKPLSAGISMGRSLLNVRLGLEPPEVVVPLVSQPAVPPPSIKLPPRTRRPEVKVK